MDINQLRSNLIEFKENHKGCFINLVTENTKYTYRHVHNFLTNEDYNVTVNFVHDMQNLLTNNNNNQ